MRMARRSVSDFRPRLFSLHFRRLLPLLLIGCTSDLVLAVQSRAQNLFGDAGFVAGRGTYSAVPYEHVDPLSGNLIVVVTDLSLPGNTGLELKVTRSYNSKFHRDFENGDLSLDERTPLGVGWRLHFGRVLYDDSTLPGTTVIETPDGGGQPLYQSIAHGWMTKQFWRYDRATSTARLPNGYVYVFGHVAETSGPRGRVRYVTEIRDPFNNRLTFEYGAGSLPGSLWKIRQHLSPTQIREVVFGYNSNGSLNSMSYDGRTWSYQYDPAPGMSGEWVLRRVVLDVVPPLGLPWEYVYADNGAGAELTGLRPPGGGRMDYVYATVTRVALTLNQLSRVVQARTTGGFEVTPGTWTFSYSQGDFFDTTIVDCECGKTTYRYYGIGYSMSYAAWQSGLLMERQVYEPGPSGALLESEVFGYEAGEPISNDPVPGQGGVWSDPAVYPALLNLHGTARDSHSWASVNHYRSGLGNYNDFGRPWRSIDMSGWSSPMRITERVFDYGFPDWIVDRLTSQSVTIGSETRTSSWVYAAATGFMTQSNAMGTVTTYTPNAAGQVASVTNANGHTVSFTYDWGVLKKTTTPLLVTDRVINPDGTIASENVGTLSTQYQYDVAFRLRRVLPPGAPAVNPIVYDYDNATNYYVRTSRGPSQVEQTLDGFGRVMVTSNQVGVRSKVLRDQCGRVTHTSMPYTLPATPAYTVTTYDALGRVKTVTLPGSPLSVTTYTYYGGDVTITDAEGRQTTYEHDRFSSPADSRLKRVTDADGKVTNYQYDVLGNLTSVAGPGPSPGRTWKYNTRGELEYDTQPEAGRTDYLYDPAGNLKQVTNALGQVLTFTYDANERLIGRDGPGAMSDMTIGYDTFGRVQTQSIEGVITTYTYDAASRPSSRTDAIHPGMTFQSQYLYDANDNLEKIIYPAGRQVIYGYDNEFRLKNVYNNSTAEIFAGPFNYDTTGRPASYATGAVTHTIDYDDRSRIKILTAGTTGVPRMHLTYTYDKVSNVKTILDARSGVLPTSQSYGYDVLNRMTSSTGPWGGITWSYDPQGNRLSEIRGSTISYSYDGLTNRLTGTTGATPETFNWNAAGQLTQNQQGATTTTFSYTPGGMLKTVSKPGVAATYLYDVDDMRLVREINGSTMVTVRSLSGQVLAEYSLVAGSPVWMRDNIYAGTRLLGSIRPDMLKSTVTFNTSASTVAENVGTVAPGVKLVTPNGGPLPHAATVVFQTNPGTAVPGTGYDYAATNGVLTIPAGTASGTVLPITPAVPIHPDTTYEAAETFTLTLTGGTGVVVGAASTHTVTIANDDPPPALSITDVAVNEPSGPAVFTVSVSALSALPVTVPYASSNQTAVATVDYGAVAGTLTVPAMSSSATIVVPIINERVPEPGSPEIFLVTLGSPTNATIADGTGIGSIVDEDWVPIDPNLAGHYFADGTALAAQDDYLNVVNRHTTAVTARMTVTRADGSGARKDFVVPADSRLGLRVGDDPAIGAEVVSMVVQSLDPARKLETTHSVYIDAWQSGRSTEGVSPSTAWYLPEGTNGYFEETITVFNPNSEPITVAVSYHGVGSLGKLGDWSYSIPTGPGRIVLRPYDVIGAQDHSSIVRGLSTGGSPRPIVVERTMTLQRGSTRRETTSSPGIRIEDLSANWYLAEGDTGFATYLAVFNPNTTAQSVTIQYLHENGTAYSESATISSSSRATFTIPAWLPIGSFGYRVTSVTGGALAVERSMYHGADWTIGTNGSGMRTPALQWFFEEGATGFFDTFVLVANPSASAANVWVAFKPDSGGLIWHNVVVPANARRTIQADYITGMPSGSFRTEVYSDQPIVAERATYWEGPSGPSFMSETLPDDQGLAAAAAAYVGASSLAPASSNGVTGTGAGVIAPADLIDGEQGTSELPPLIGPTPYRGPRAQPPANVYQLTPAIPGGPIERALFEAETARRSKTADPQRAAGEAASFSVVPALSWYSGHVTPGRQP
jgi:YD repeat-containing protein